MAIKYNGKDVPHFLIVNDITNSLFPNISQTRFNVPGKAGSFDFGNEIGERIIDVSFSILSSNPKELKQHERELQEWLYYEESKELVILDEADKYYKAKLTGDTSISEVFKVGKGTVSFLCSDPFAYSKTEKAFIFNPADAIAYPFNNEGGTDTFPKMKFEFIEPVSSFTIATDEEFILLGQTVSLTSGKAEDLEPRVLWDEMHSLAPWTSPVYTSDSRSPSNAIQGNFVSNGYSFSVEDFGTSNGVWHGPSLVRSLSRDVQDFKISMQCGFKASHPKQLGRVELYLINQDRKEFGKIAIEETTSTNNHPKVEARAGTWETIGSKYFVNDFGAFPGVFGNWVLGMMEISRSGNVWTAYFAIIDQQTGRRHTSLTKKWVDSGNLWLDPLSMIQIHIGKYGENEPFNSMYIADIKVHDLKPEISNPENKEISPFVFYPGDILEIENERGLILKNGVPFYSHLEPSSRFIKFRKGNNGLTVSPPLSTSNGEISFRERWL